MESQGVCYEVIAPRCLQAIEFHNVLVVHLDYGHGVAGKRALQQIQLLQCQLGRVSAEDQQIIINIRPLLRAKFFVEEFKDIDVDLLEFLEAWLSISKQVSIFPKLPSALHDINALNQQGNVAVWVKFWARYSHRFVATLP